MVRPVSSPGRTGLLLPAPGLLLLACSPSTSRSENGPRRPVGVALGLSWLAPLARLDCSELGQRSSGQCPPALERPVTLTRAPLGSLTPTGRSVVVRPPCRCGSCCRPGPPTPSPARTPPARRSRRPRSPPRPKAPAARASRAPAPASTPHPPSSPWVANYHWRRQNFTESEEVSSGRVEWIGGVASLTPGPIGTAGR
jgi:hypothetical protein